MLSYLFERQLANFEFFFETSNGRLPLEQSSDRRETLAKRVSDDLQLFIFRPRKKILDKIFSKIFRVEFFFQKNEVLEELRFFFPRWHVRRKKLLPEVPLFWGRLPWRRGKRFNMCRKPGFGTEFTSTIGCCDWMIYDLSLIHI